MLRLGKWYPVASMAFANASSTSRPKQPTSPVEAISTPERGSVPLIRLNENWGTLTATYGSASMLGAVLQEAGICNMRRVASRMKLMPRVFEMNGKLREARRLHSITFTSWSRASSWTLKGPVMCRAQARSSVMARARLIVWRESPCGGQTKVASPEWIPAFSRCSETAHKTTSPLSATASHSNSRASLSNLDSTTGCSRDTSTACARNDCSSSWLWATRNQDELRDRKSTRLNSSHLVI